MTPPLVQEISSNSPFNLPLLEIREAQNASWKVDGGESLQTAETISITRRASTEINIAEVGEAKSPANELKFLKTEFGRKPSSQDLDRKNTSFIETIARTDSLFSAETDSRSSGESSPRCVEAECEDPRVERDVDEETCFICLGAFSFTEPSTAMPCKNSVCRQTPVHAHCIYEWKQTHRKKSSSQRFRSKSKSTCPLCRGPLERFNFQPKDAIKSAEFKNVDFRRNFLNTPVSPQAGFVRCFIKLNHIPADSSANNSSQSQGPRQDMMVYELYLQAPTTLKYPLGPCPDSLSPTEGDRLLAIGNRTRYPKSGVKRDADKMRGMEVYSPVSQIDLYMTDARFSRKCLPDNYLGSVKSSFSGFKHEVLMPINVKEVNARNAKAQRKGEKLKAAIGYEYEETCCVHFVQNKKSGKSNSSPGPRKIQVCLPKVKGSQQNSNSQQDELVVPMGATPPLETSRKIPGRLSHALTYKSLNMAFTNMPGEFTFGRNKEPYWLESIQAYSLDFKGRVTMPSNKNFQILLDKDDGCTDYSNDENIVPELMKDKLSDEGKCDQDDIALQCGKVGENGNSEIFSLDFRYPLTPLQAFGICLGACDRNIGNSS